jgi:hypothetical protein
MTNTFWIITTTPQQEHNIREHGSIADHIDYTMKRETLLIGKR